MCNDLLIADRSDLSLWSHVLVSLAIDGSWYSFDNGQDTYFVVTLMWFSRA